MISPTILSPRHPRIITIHIPSTTVVPSNPNCSPNGLTLGVACDTCSEVVRIRERTSTLSEIRRQSEDVRKLTLRDLAFPVSIPIALDLDVGVGFALGLDDVFVGVEGHSAAIEVAIGGIDEVVSWSSHFDY